MWVQCHSLQYCRDVVTDVGDVDNNSGRWEAGDVVSEDVFFCVVVVTLLSGPGVWPGGCGGGEVGRDLLLLSSGGRRWPGQWAYTSLRPRCVCVTTVLPSVLLLLLD